MNIYRKTIVSGCIMSKFNKRLLSVVVGLLFLLSITYAGKRAELFTMGEGAGGMEAEFCVVIDAGHAGGN